eukprot:6482290-Amphidinium_carterae.1
MAMFQLSTYISNDVEATGQILLLLHGDGAHRSQGHLLRIKSSTFSAASSASSLIRSEGTLHPNNDIYISTPSVASQHQLRQWSCTQHASLSTTCTHACAQGDAPQNADAGPPQWGLVHLAHKHTIMSGITQPTINSPPMLLSKRSRHR